MPKLRRKLLPAILLFLAGYGCLHEVSRSLRRTAVCNARITIIAAYSEYRRTGKIPKSGGAASFREYTNIVSVDGTNYQPVLAMNWSVLSDGVFIITTNQTTIWLGSGGGSKLIGTAYRAPFFSGGL